MNFSKLYNRVVYNEAKEKQKREENVEQYDHSASAAEQEEEYDERDDAFGTIQRTWEAEQIKVKLPDRTGGDYYADGIVTYTLEEELPCAANGYIGSVWPEVENVEVTSIFLMGDEHHDEQDITDDVTFEEMDIVEQAIEAAFEHTAQDYWFDR